MAKERTFAAWVRTALGAMGGGFALAKVAEELDWGWLVMISGLGLIVAGVVVHLGALWQARRWTRAEGLEGLPGWVLAFVTITVAMAAVEMIKVLLE